MPKDLLFAYIGAHLTSSRMKWWFQERGEERRRESFFLSSDPPVPATGGRFLLECDPGSKQWVSGLCERPGRK